MSGRGIVRKISNFQFLEKQSNRVTIWKGKIQNKILVILYDKMRKQPITCLTEEMYSKREWDLN